MRDEQGRLSRWREAAILWHIVSYLFSDPGEDAIGRQRLGGQIDAIGKTIAHA